MKQSYEQWAATELGIDPGAGVVTARSSFLAQLDAGGLLPAECKVAAWNYWAEYGVPVSRRARSRSGSSPIFDAFLAEFWLLSPAQREVRWKELSEDDPSAVVARRLHNMKIGLTVQGTSNDGDPKVDALGGILRELLLLPANRRAKRRREWLESIENPDEWKEALRKLSASEPLVSEFDPTLVTWLDETVHVVHRTVDIATLESDRESSHVSSSMGIEEFEKRQADWQSSLNQSRDYGERSVVESIQIWFRYFSESWHRVMFVALAGALLIAILPPGEPAPPERKATKYHYSESAPLQDNRRQTLPKLPFWVAPDFEPTRPWTFDPNQLKALTTRQ